MISSPYLARRDRYVRAIEGWADNTHEDAFTHTVRLTDDDHAVELCAVCTPSPGYEVREARARVLAGPADPGIAAALESLGGVRMVAGFTRRLAEICGPGIGAGIFVDAGIEIARLARQVTKLPPAVTAGLLPGDAARCWNLDAAGFSDLPGSCFTYSAAGRALLGTRDVTTSMARELYSPPPGATKVFARRKESRLVRLGERLELFQSMHDNVHGFDIHLSIDTGTGRIVAADSVTSRLPYAGICSEPQARISSLIGLPADGELRKRIQTLLGGEAGCAQLYDLATDLLKLLVFA